VQLDTDSDYDCSVSDSESLVANDAGLLSGRLSFRLGLALAAALFIGFASWALRLTPWLLVVIVLCLVALALAQWTNLRVGISGALLGVLGGYAILVRLFPHFNVPLEVSSGVALLLLGLAAIALIALRAQQRQLLLPSVKFSFVIAVILAGVLLIALAWVPWATSRGQGPIWAMHGDVVGQANHTRSIINNGGVNIAQNTNSAPLTAALLAIPIAIRGGASAGNLANIAAGSADIWIFALFATSILAALITWSQIKRRVNIWLKLAAVVAVGILPLTWYFAGFALQHGFHNSTLSLVMLLACWHIWLESPRLNPAITIGLLSFGTVALLATWAPMALIPISLAALTLIFPLRRLAQQNTLTARAIAPLFLAALPMVLYALFVTLRDFAYEGDALALDGAIQIFPARHFVWVLVLVGLTTAIVSVVSRRNYVIWGLTATYVASLIGLAFLVRLRVSLGLPFPPQEDIGWGYYPIKMAWGIAMLLLIIGLAAALSWIVNSTRSIPLAGLAAILTVAVTGTLMLQVRPWPQLFTPLDILRSRVASPGQEPWRANIIFESDASGRPVIAVRYSSLDHIDQFVNSWLLQAHNTPQDSSMEIFGYMRFDPEDLDQVCHAIVAWHRPVVVLSHDPALAGELQTLCPNADFTVELGYPNWP